MTGANPMIGKRLIPLCLAFAQASPAAQAESDRPLPSPCEILTAVDAAGRLGLEGAAEMSETPPREEYGIRLSDCTLSAGGSSIYSLTLRENVSPEVAPAPAQLDSFLRGFAEFWGTEPDAQPVDLPVPAVWIPALNQIVAFARNGHAMVMVTVPGSAGIAGATDFARPILAAIEQDG